VLHYGEFTDSANLILIIQQVQSDEIYTWVPRAMLR